MSYERLGRVDQGLRRKTLLDKVTTTGQSVILRAGRDLGETPAAFRVQVEGSGEVSTVVKLMGSTRDEILGGIELAAFTLSGTDIDQAGVTLNVDWPFIWYDVTSLSSGASVTAEVSVDG